jgi:hypothetical protein
MPTAMVSATKTMRPAGRAFNRWSRPRRTARPSVGRTIRSNDCRHSGDSQCGCGVRVWVHSQTAQTVCGIVNPENVARLKAIVADRSYALKYAERARIFLASQSRASPLPAMDLPLRTDLGLLAQCL